MFALRPTILRLRTQCPAFNKYVGGASELGQAYDILHSGEDLADLPTAFVVPLYEQDISSQLASYSPEDDERLEHKIEQHFAVIVCVSNATGSGKQGKGTKPATSTEMLASLQAELNKALLGWRPTPTCTPVRFHRSDHMAISNKYLWHSFEFTLAYTFNPSVTPEDEARMEAIVNGFEDMPSQGGAGGVTKITVGRTTSQRPTVLDYYDPSPFAGDSTQQLAAAEGRKDAEFEAEFPALDEEPSGKDVYEAAEHPEPPPPNGRIQWHGVEDEEVNQDD